MFSSEKAHINSRIITVIGRLFLALLFILLCIRTHVYFTTLYRIEKLEKKQQLQAKQILIQTRMLRTLENKKCKLENTVTRLRVKNTVESLRSLVFLETPLFRSLHREKLKAFVVEEFAKELPPEEIEKIKKVLFVLGFLPKNYDLEKILINLYSEQIGAFYKMEEKALYMLPGLNVSTNIQKTLLAHEMTHALQDQHFNLEQIIKSGKDNDDTKLAIESLVEGDATFVMQKYYVKTLSLSFIFDIISILFLGQEQFDKAPDVIKENLIFPYIKGLVFVSYLFRSGGWETVDNAYKQLPLSSEQILHPEKYIAGEKPVTVELSGDFTTPVSYSILERNTLGEFNTALLLERYLPNTTSRSAAKGWGGDTYIILESPTESAFVLIWKTVWDSELDANEFFQAYKKFILARYHKISETPREDNHIALFEKENRYVFIEKRDLSVIIIDLSDEKIKDAFLKNLETPKIPRQ